MTKQQRTRNPLAEAQRLLPPGSIDEAIARALNDQWELGSFDGIGPDTLDGGLRGLVSQAAAPFTDSAARTLEAGGGSEWEPLQDLDSVGPRAIWTDLRPSEAVALMTAVSDAVDRAVAVCSRVIRTELEGAGQAFAAAYPDAPRVEKEVGQP